MLQALSEALRAGIETTLPTAVSGQMAVKLSGKTEQAILQALRQSPDMTIPQLAAQIGSSTRTVERHLHKLQQQGLLKRTGPKKTGRWQVIDNDKEGNV